MALLPRAVISLLLFSTGYLLISSVAEAQWRGPCRPPTGDDGGLPDASFGVTFRKYTPPRTAFSPFASWDAELAFSATAFRRGSNAVTVGAVVQSIGTENVGSHVRVGAIGYLINLAYVHDCSDDFKISAGTTHLSSHLTRDLDRKLREVGGHGAPIPRVSDATEYNVLFFGVYWRFARFRFTPELDVVVQPLNVLPAGGGAGYVRPIYLSTRSTLWKGAQKSLAVETQHEFGRNAFNNVALLFELYDSKRQTRRFQVFVSASPGHGAHVSPKIGGLRDGIAVGVRMEFDARAQ